MFRDAGPSRTERQPHTELTAAREPAREQQPGDVAAADEHQARNGTEQQEEDWTRFACKVGLQAGDGDIVAAIEVGELGRQIARDPRHVLACPIERHPGFHPRHHLQKVAAALELNGLGNRGPEIRKNSVRSARKREAWRHDADHLERPVVQLDRPADESGVSAEAIAPEPIAQDHDLSIARNVLVRPERTAGRGWNAHDSEEP